MKCIRLALALAGCLFVSNALHAATFKENFSANPLENGWRVFGDTNLFQWDTVNQNLDVTWDSLQSNSYFYHPLGTVLTTNDDFSVAFDLQINSAQAYNYGFELAVGLLNLDEATSTNFNRSTGYNSPDLFEFDYFPDVGYGPTVWPLIVDSSSDFNYNTNTVLDYAIYQPNPGDWYHINMSFAASNQTMTTTMTNFEGTSGLVIVDPLAATTGNFYVNTVSVSSYEDDGYGDTIYAQGAVDNFCLTLPPPAVQHLTGVMTNGAWQAQFLSQSNWLYNLERTTNFQCWQAASPVLPGSGTNLCLQDTNPPAQKAFYRINAARP